MPENNQEINQGNNEGSNKSNNRVQQFQDEANFARLEWRIANGLVPLSENEEENEKRAAIALVDKILQNPMSGDDDVDFTRKRGEKFKVPEGMAVFHSRNEFKIALEYIKKTYGFRDGWVKKFLMEQDYKLMEAREKYEDRVVFDYMITVKKIGDNLSITTGNLTEMMSNDSENIKK